MTDGDKANAWMTAAGVIFVATPVLAAGVCVLTRRAVGAWVFGPVAAVCGVLVHASLYVDARQAELYRPVPSLPSGYCAEYSDCPGG